jgi:DNA-binding transcriptional MocR family regulator
VGDGTFARQAGLDTKRDKGFRTFVDEPPAYFDMSRNMYIPGDEGPLLAKTLQDLSNDPQTLRQLSLYVPEVGLPRCREAGAHWMTHQAFLPSPDQVLCVNGAQHGLLCTLMALVRPGETLVTEHLTYPGLIAAARFLGIKLLGAEMDNEGLLPASLEQLCRSNRVSALYCTPTIQNPTNGVLSIQRREAIARICQQHNLLIFEDEAHGVLVDDRPPPLSVFAPERSILISSFSKAVVAGLRVGYLHAPLPLVSRLAAALRSTDTPGNGVGTYLD